MKDYLSYKKPRKIKGVYCLLINLNKDTCIKVGAIGKISFKKGYYCYVGSAQNNLIARVSRHLRSRKTIRWHIDYLLKSRNSSIKKVLYKASGKKEECRIAGTLNRHFRPVLKSDRGFNGPERLFLSIIHYKAD